jgi:lipocalin
MQLFALILLFSSLSCCLSKEYKAVDELIISQYMGKWYQVYKDNFDNLFQKNGICSTAEYSLSEDNIVKVLNTQITNNKYDSISGIAYYNDDDCCGYLTVELQGQSSAPYWVLELGPIVDNKYDYSIVSDNNAISLFVLTRDVDRFYKLYQEQVDASLTDFGFTKAYNKPETMNQTNCIVNN